MTLTKEDYSLNLQSFFSNCTSEMSLPFHFMILKKGGLDKSSVIFFYYNNQILATLLTILLRHVKAAFYVITKKDVLEM